MDSGSLQELVAAADCLIYPIEGSKATKAGWMSGVDLEQDLFWRVLTLAEPLLHLNYPPLTFVKTQAHYLVVQEQSLLV